MIASEPAPVIATGAVDDRGVTVPRGPPSRICMRRHFVKLVAVCLLSGCSFGARIVAPRTCSIAPPVLDAVAGALFVRASHWAHTENRGGPDLGPILIGVPATVLSVLAVSAAAYGYHRHASCIDQQQRDDAAARQRQLAETARPVCEQQRLAQFILATQDLVAADRERRLRAIPASCMLASPPASRAALVEISAGGDASMEQYGGSQRSVAMAGALRFNPASSVRVLAQIGVSETPGSTPYTRVDGAFVRAGGGLMMRSCVELFCGLVGFEIAYQRQARPGGYHHGPTLGERAGVEIGGTRWRVQLTGEHYLFPRYRAGRYSAGQRSGDPAALAGFGVNLSLVVSLGGPLQPPEPRPIEDPGDAMWQQIILAATAATVGDCAAVRKAVADLGTLPPDLSRGFESDPAIRACRAP